MEVSGRFPDSDERQESHGKPREGGNDEHPSPAESACVEDKVETESHAVAEVDPPVVKPQRSTSELLKSV